MTSAVPTSQYIVVNFKGVAKMTTPLQVPTSQYIVANMSRRFTDSPIVVVVPTSQYIVANKWGA